MKRGGGAAALGTVLLLAALRLRDFVEGGTFSFRDAGFFFVPWREAFARLLRRGELPLWNEAAGCGRALAADPNGAAFWPLTPLVALFGTTPYVLAQVALALALFFVALRLIPLPAPAAAAGAAVLLFSGVFQTLPVLFTTLASASTLPLAAVALAGLTPSDREGTRRRVAGAALALGLSFLGGEPAITGIGAFACVILVVARSTGEAARGERSTAALRLGALGATGVLSLALSAVQLLPAAGELSRSARGAGMRPEDGALFWSVRPARLVTLLEPRLTGDPFADEADDYWGAGTFDAGNPYFYDLAIGLVPLVLAGAAALDPRGRAALALAATGALLASGHHLPGLAAAFSRVTVFRYPEKWWLLSTYALATAAAIGLARCREERAAGVGGRFLTAAGSTALGLAAPAGLLALLGAAAPERLRGLLWSLGLGAGPAGAGRVATILLPLLVTAFATLLLLALLSHLLSSGRLGPWSTRGAELAVVAVFLVDASRRVAGTCPAGPPGLWEKKTAETEAVVREMQRGRFHDEGADRPGVAVARVVERGGFDQLRPVTGTVFGVAYAGDNDIDRMTPEAALAWTRSVARLPWGERKLRWLRRAGVAVVRTRSGEADPPGVQEIGRFGGDRLLRVEDPRPLVTLLPHAVIVPPGAPVPDAGESPSTRAALELPGAPSGPRAFGAGHVEVLAWSSGRQSLSVTVEEPGGFLVVSRPRDPSWKATVDGRPLETHRVDSFLTGLLLPAGKSRVELAYRNPLLLAGGVATAVSLGILLAMAFGGRRTLS